MQVGLTATPRQLKRPDAEEGEEVTAAPEQPRAQIILQVVDARAHGRLGDMQALGGFKETAMGCDREKSSSLIDVHVGALAAYISKISILSSNRFR